MLQKQIEIQNTERRRKDQLGHAALLYPDEDNDGWTLESPCNFLQIIFVGYKLEIQTQSIKH